MSKQFYEELLAKFMKANKKRRIYIAEKAGYTSAEEYKKFLQKNIKKETKKVITEEENSDISMLDMVIAFDTTGSMSSYIEAVRKHVKELIPNLFKNSPKLKMKIIAFGDYCDMESPRIFGNAYQETTFTNNQNTLIDFVNKAKNTSGGDSDEFYELVIKKIVKETPWRPEAKKAVLLIADCDPHYVGYTYTNTNGKTIVKNNKIDWREEAKKAAEKGIQFDTLTILERYPSWYKELSRITGGVSLPFKSSNKISQVIEGITYARSSKTAYRCSSATVTASGDKELIGAYKTIETLL